VEIVKTPLIYNMDGLVCLQQRISELLADNRPDNTGLDDGPYLPGQAPRKRPVPKSSEEVTDIRARAWITRRAKYGDGGHR